jgi:Pvc16 N-terminal domain
VSSPLALAAVTATLCDLLNNGLIDNDLSPVGSFSVTALPPDRIETGATETNRLNLFLYQVTPNPGWRNEGLPSRDASDPRIRLSNPPLALDLHYMLTAYGSADFAAEILLGYGMDVLHEARGLSRKNIRDALAPTNPISVALVPVDPQGRKAVDLADQVELVKITPQYLSSDELSRLWTAMQARYRPTMVYQVSTVLIQGKRAIRKALPVLARGKDDAGVGSQPNLDPAAPTRPTVMSIRVVSAVAGEQRVAAEQGDALELSGALLAGDTVTAEFRHPLFKRAPSGVTAVPIEQKVEPESTAARALVILPQSHDATQTKSFVAGADAEWPAGTYTIVLRIERTGKVTRWTDPTTFWLAPRLSATPVLSGSGATLAISTQVFPQVWPEQKAEIVVGSQPFDPAPITRKSGKLKASLVGVTKSEEPVPVTVRVDGVSSELVRDRASQPPEFDPTQKVKLPL